MTGWTLSDQVNLASGRIPPHDAERQQATANAILERLVNQPGVVLADDVGMGKTFVAFAVAASVILANPENQVVVMVPPAVRDKWPTDWTVFQRDCFGDGPPIAVTTTTVTSGSEFLKLLDDPPDRRKQLIFVTHRAMARRLQDPFVKLALIRRAFWKRSSLSAQRQAFPRWASQVLADPRFNDEVTEALLAAQPTTWRALWMRVTGDPLDDDPVPDAVISVLDDIDLSGIREALAALPLRSSAYVRQRLSAVRKALKEPLDAVWGDALNRSSSQLPLLILDEAHHLKNPNKLRGLFATEDGAAADELRGPMFGMFERMLLLTATPFQLGHGELIAVLRLFGSTVMSTDDRAGFQATVDALAASLDRSQSASLHLDRQWARLRSADLESLSSDWWTQDATGLPERLGSVASAVRTCEYCLDEAATMLRPWVIRHSKARHRSYLPGAATLPVEVLGDGSEASLPDPGGLSIAGQSVLPFLLATRAQSLVRLRGQEQDTRTRALFAEGLASSFEAYLHTRGQAAVADLEEALDEATSLPDSSEPGDIQWYLDHIAEAVPAHDADRLAAHPKINATLQRTLLHWRQREKVLVFCFFRATGEALRQHISDSLAAEITSIAHARFGVSGEDRQAVFAELGDRADSLLRSDRPGGRAVLRQARAIGVQVGLEVDDVTALAGVTLRFLRSPSFLVRYVDLSSTSGERAVADTFEVIDGGGLAFGARLTTFAERVCQFTDEERTELWNGLRRVRTGTRRVDQHDEDEDGGSEEDGGLLLPDVRLANGGVGGDERRRLMATFNTPFLPDVLVASSVMSEGVDLHRECRHVIHHDLDWNPSTLEQRTGRVDRIGSRSELTGRPIVVCEPYVAGTQDERQFRVVKERERWFGVLMGGSVPTDEWATEKLAERIPLPLELASRLMLDLSVWQAPSA
jgi:ERCC4-related helicase